MILNTHGLRPFVLNISLHYSFCTNNFNSWCNFKCKLFLYSAIPHFNFRVMMVMTDCMSTLDTIQAVQLYGNYMEMSLVFRGLQPLIPSSFICFGIQTMQTMLVLNSKAASEDYKPKLIDYQSLITWVLHLKIFRM